MENYRSETYTSNEDFTMVRPNPAKIKVIGVGGGGGNAVNRMVRAGLSGVEFYLMNTDLQVLQTSPVKNKIQLGKETTKGLGAGADPEVGAKAAEEAKQEITEALEGSDMVFVTAGMGGGTGTGAVPIIASIAKSLDILTIGVVTKPFKYEGKRRATLANEGLEKLKEAVDALIVIPNDNLMDIVDQKVSFQDSFAVVDDVLLRGVQGISDIITIPGLINVDFADVRSVMKASGSALMGIGRGQGEGRAEEAAHRAIDSKMLESSINGARGVIVNITAGADLTLHEVNNALEVINDAVLDDANIIIGAVINENIQGEIQMTVIATGFELEANKPLSRQVEATKSLSPRDFFEGFGASSRKMVESNDLNIPDFLKK